MQIVLVLRCLPAPHPRLGPTPPATRPHPHSETDHRLARKALEAKRQALVSRSHGAHAATAIERHRRALLTEDDSWPPPEGWCGDGTGVGDGAEEQALAHAAPQPAAAAVRASTPAAAMASLEVRVEYSVLTAPAPWAGFTLRIAVSPSAPHPSPHTTYTLTCSHICAPFDPNLMLPLAARTSLARQWHWRGTARRLLLRLSPRLRAAFSATPRCCRCESQ